MFLSGIVHLSAYIVSSSEEAWLVHGLGLCPTSGAPDPEVQRRVIVYVNVVLYRGQISDQATTYLTNDIDRTQQLHLLHKTRKDKDPNKKNHGRPI